MVIRVVFALALLAAAAAPATAQRAPANLIDMSRGGMLRYDFDGLLFERAPDHVSLGYDLEGLTGTVATYRMIRDYGPLDYNLEGLIFAQLSRDWQARAFAD